MLVKKYRSRIINIISPFEGIYTLEFESLNGPYKFYPGQFLHLALDQDYDGSGQWPESRCFSMQSNPNDTTVKITYSVKGKYTRQMEEALKAGSEVWLKLPYGELFTQSHNKLNTVFIAGGTGITPFLSLFTHESFQKYINPRIYLGFKSVSYNIYHKELKNVKDINPVIFYEDINGVMDISLIFSQNGKNCDYFLSGPPTMIKTFKNKLLAEGVADCRIITDDWE